MGFEKLCSIFAAMDTVFFIPIAILLIGGAFVIGMIRNRNFDKKEKLHQKLAQALGLSLSYQNQKDFTIYGYYRSYPLRIEGISINSPELKKPFHAVKCSISMVNPQLKILRIAKSHPEFELFENLVILDRPVHMPHNLGDWLDISTNDLMFGSILLSDDIKISLFEVFNHQRCTNKKSFGIQPSNNCKNSYLVHINPFW